MSSTSGASPRGRALEAVDEPVDQRAQDEQQLAHELGDLRAQLGRQDVAQRLQQRDQRLHLARASPACGGGHAQPLRGARSAMSRSAASVRRADALAQLLERIAFGLRHG